MLLYPDGKTALESAIDPATFKLKEKGAEILACAAQTIPSRPGEFIAAAQMLVYAIKTGLVHEAEAAAAHAEAVLKAAEEGRLNGALLHHLRQLLPLCRPMEDALPLMVVGGLMEAMRPRQV